MDKATVIALIQMILIIANAIFTTKKVGKPRGVLEFDKNGDPKFVIPWNQLTYDRKFVIEMILGTIILAITTYYIFIFGRYSIFQIIILLLTFYSLRVTWKEMKTYDKFKEEVYRKVQEKYKDDEDNLN